MKKNRLVGGIISATLLTAALAPTGCGYFLHPERRGNSGGGVDTLTLVFDLLWLIPGIVPGVIALVVDFSSGAIYVGGGGRRSGLVLSPEGNVDVRVAGSTKPQKLEFRFSREDQSELARKVVFVQPSKDGQTIQLQIAPTLRPTGNAKIYVEVVAVDATPAAVATKR